MLFQLKSKVNCEEKMFFVCMPLWPNELSRCQMTLHCLTQNKQEKYRHSCSSGYGFFGNLKDLY